MTQICSALALDLEHNGDGAESFKIEELEEIAVGDEEMIIPLKAGEDGKDHYCTVEVAVIVNNKHDDYDKYVSSITEKQSLVKDAINSEISSFTIDEFKSNPEVVQDAVCGRLQKLFNSHFIVKVAFKKLVYQ